MNKCLTTIRVLFAISILVSQGYVVQCDDDDELELLGKLSELGDIDASSYFVEVFENIKQEEAEKLDPIILDNKIDELFVKKDVNVNIAIDRGFKIEGMSQVSLRNFSGIINFDEMRLDVGADIVLPELKGTGTYVMKGKAFKYFPIRGNGRVMIEIKGISGNASVFANIYGDKLEAESIDIKLYPSEIKLHFENLINSNLSRFFNTILNHLAKPLFNKLLMNNKNTMDNINVKLLEEINKQLASFDVTKLLDELSNVHK